jgi:hypothetical protein
MALPNWYKILGVPENITNGGLERLLDKERLEHHPDRHSTASQAEKDRHTERLKTVLDGVSFLLSEHGKELLDAQLREERAAQARAKAEKLRERNQQEAEERGDADDLRRQFGSPPSPKVRATPTGTGHSSGPPRTTGRPASSSPPRSTPSQPFKPPSRPAPATANSSDWFATICTYLGVVAFVVAPFPLMYATGLAKNSNAWENGNLLAALVMIILGLWGIASIGIAVCVIGYLAFAGVRQLLGAISK